MFTLYPDAGARSLQVPRANARHDIAITQLTGAAPPELLDTFTKVMYLRIAALSGQSTPILRLRADTGGERPLTAQFETIFSRPGQEAPVGQAKLTAQPANTWLVTIGFFANTSHTWTLGITNTATDADYAYTIIAADTEAETQHPWLAPTFTKANCKDLHDVSFFDERKPLSVCVDSATHTAYVAVMGVSISKIVDGNRSPVATPSDVFQIAHDSIADKLFVTQPATSTLAVVKGANITGPIQIGTAGNPGFPRLSVDSPNRKVYAVRDPQDIVTVVDADVQTVTNILPVGRHPSCVVADPNVNTAYVASLLDKSMTVVKAGVVTGTLPCVETPSSAVVGPDGGTVWTGSGVGPQIGVTDVKSRICTTLAVIDDFHSVDFIAGVAVDPRRYLVYVYAGSHGREESPLFIFDSRITPKPIQAVRPDGSRYITLAYASPAIDLSTGLLHVGFGHTSSPFTGFHTVKTTVA